MKIGIILCIALCFGIFSCREDHNAEPMSESDQKKASEKKQNITADVICDIETRPSSDLERRVELNFETDEGSAVAMGNFEGEFIQISVYGNPENRYLQFDVCAYDVDREQLAVCSLVAATNLRSPQTKLVYKGIEADCSVNIDQFAKEQE